MKNHILRYSAASLVFVQMLLAAQEGFAQGKKEGVLTPEEIDIVKQKKLIYQVPTVFSRKSL